MRLRLHGGLHLHKDVDEIVDPDEIAVLVVAHLPGGVVIDAQLRRQLHRLGKVNQPDAGMVLVVDEEQRAADDLVALEELRDRQGGADSA